MNRIKRGIAWKMGKRIKEWLELVNSWITLLENGVGR